MPGRDEVQKRFPGSRFSRSIRRSQAAESLPVPLILTLRIHLGRIVHGEMAEITRNKNQLIGQIAGLNRLTRYPESASTFFVKEADLRIVFEGYEDDQTIGFTVLTAADTVTIQFMME